MADFIGQQFGNYRLLRLLGQGAFASVYLAEHCYLEILAPVKVLNVKIDAKTRTSFLSEARTIAHLQHPHIVRVNDFGFQEQMPYLVMEYMPNGTLRTLYPKGTQLPFEEIVSYTKQIAAALDYAHEQHVIHRDIKPENILLNAKKEAVLSDFGLAVVQRTLESLSTQEPAGTPRYMAPEHIQGKPCAASDQYALGVMVYEWLAGEPPFLGPGIAVFGQHLHQLPPSLCARLPGLRPAVEDAVFGALAKNPVQRFGSASDFALALEEACSATQPLTGSVSTENNSQELDDPTQPMDVVRVAHQPASVRSIVQTVSPIANPHQLIAQRPSTPVSVMCVCAPVDQALLEQWEAHLRPLEQSGAIAVWSEDHLLAGSPRQEQIDAHLAQVHLIILLLSADFFSSEDCIALMHQAIFQQRNRGIQVVPLLLRPVEWQVSPLAPLSRMPSNGPAVTAWSNTDVAFDWCVRDLCRLLGLPVTSSLRSQQAPFPSMHHQNRMRLLRRVRSFWIEDVLEHALHGAELIPLELQTQPDVVTNAWHQVIPQSETTPLRPLPMGRSITQVYDAADGELLILGAPGAGKTTQLLELAKDLLERAEGDERHPMPIVFNLSSWSTKQRSLADWLVEELVSRYQVPRKLGQTFIEDGQILPLLDGLDEVPPKERTACIEAINRYRQEHGLLPLVVCSRIADYLAQTARLQLDSAVAIQPLTAQQIDTYLLHGGKPLQVLQVALRQDAELLELARVPLMLNILAQAYQGQPLNAEVLTGSPSARQRYIFTTYVQRMLERRGVAKPYIREQTIRWLAYLARQMKRQGQTVFYIERMQPDWLEDQRSRKRYPHLVYGLTFALIGALCLGPAGGGLYSLSSDVGGLLAGTLVLGLISASLFGLPNGLIAERPSVKRSDGRNRWSWRRLGERMGRALINGCLVGLLIGLPISLLALQQEKGQNTFAFALAIVAIYSFLGGLVSLLIDGILGIQTTEIRPTETYVWSWTRMGHQFLKFAGLGLLAAFLLWLLIAVYEGLYLWIVTEMKSWLMILQNVWVQELDITKAVAPFLVFLVLLSGLSGALTGGVASNMLNERHLIKPNQGIRLSALHSVLIGTASLLIGGVVGGLLAVVVTHNITNTNIMLTYGLVLGSLVGLVNGLRSGGVACIQHVALRWLLRETGKLPWNYARFLDYAAERVLLRKVGGGYIFIHRLLLEYFASL
ncbi:MAG: protein kinase domain-containing protein [Ktedonobacteraceae bacterium]